MDFNYYNATDIPYPSNVGPKKPSLPANVTAVSAQQFADLMVVYEKERAVYVEAVRQYNETVQHRLTEFRQAIQKEYALTDQQMNLLWEAAWDEGDRDGLEEVYYHFQKYHDLVTKFAAETS
jgi:hypothetical protein